MLALLPLLLLAGPAAAVTTTTLGNLSGIGMEVKTLEKLKATLLEGYNKERVPQASLVVPVNVSLYMWPYDILYIGTIKMSGWLDMYWTDAFLRWDPAEFGGISNIFLGADHLWLPSVDIFYTYSPVSKVEREAQGTIKMSGWLDMYWTDAFLRWDPAEFGGISNIFLGADHLWLPSVDIFYTKEDVLKPAICGSNCYVRVDHTGAILRGLYFSYAFPCSFNVKYFPFDRQQCELEVANWNLDESIMDLWPKGDRVDMSVFLPNEEWDLENITVIRKSVYYVYGNFPSIVYKITVSRKPFYYVCNLIFPSVIITGAAVIGYHMPSTGTGIHQEKVKMGLTAILSIFILQLGIADKLPRTSKSIPLINIFYFCLVAILSLAILVTSLVILVEKQGLEGKPVPDRWRRLFLLSSSPSSPHHPTATIPSYSYSSLHVLQRDESMEVDTETESLSNHLLDSVYFSPKKLVQQANGVKADVSAIPEKKSPEQPIMTELRRTLMELKQFLRARQETQRIRYEWSLLADSLEKISMAVFIMAIAFSCIIFAFHDWY